MHPLLAHGRWLAAYLAAWLPLAGLLAAVMALAGPSPWQEAGLVAPLLAVLLAFICLATWYGCRAVPVGSSVARVVVTHLVGGAASVGLWLVAAANLAVLLGQAPAFAGAEARFVRYAPIVGGVAFLLYLLAVAGNYLLLAVEQTRERDRRALELELVARRAELASLRARIDPHFLFNSLNSVAALIGAEPGAARATCIALADFLRASLRLGTSEAIPLTEELALVRDYVAVEQVRLGDRLRFDARVAPDAGACLVPPLVLQPLVENAITHGIAPSLAGGTVRVEASCAGGALVLVVENLVEDGAASRAGAGLGLDTVRRRLAAQYGDAGILTVRREAGRFRAECRLPASPAAAAAAAGGQTPLRQEVERS